MIRDIGAGFAGMVVGSIVNMAFIFLSIAIWPLPEGTDMSDTAAMVAHVNSVPIGALLVVVVAHLGQAFVGGWVAARISLERPMLLAMIVGVLTLLGGVLNMVNLQGPAWMWIEVPLYLVVAAAAGQLELMRRGNPSA